MCGVFGLQIKNKEKLNVRELTSLLFKISQARGNDASGLCIKYNGKNKIIKKGVSGERLSKSKDFKNLFDNLEKSGENHISLIGQCRLATNGETFFEENNQPVINEKICLIHNGIILNANQILENKISSSSDSILFAEIIKNSYQNTKNFYDSFNKLNKEINGSYSIAFFDNISENLYLTTNNGSLHFFFSENFLVFASEKNFLETFLNKIGKKFIKKDIKQLKPLDFITFSNCNVFINEQNKNIKNENLKKSSSFVFIKDNFVEKLKRCSQCILPETYPFISFDAQGVCNFCLDKKNDKKLKKNLESILSKYRSKNGEPDCLVGLSGGRDSSYGLHVLKKEYEMNPIAYTYDWGLTTDTSRKNQALMTGKLGVEHIIRSPDLSKKRENVRKNIYAWLKRPHLGMVPIFMAGDKDFYEYGRTIRKKNKLKLTIFCSGQRHEQRNFFVGFCGVKDNIAAKTARLYDYPLKIKIRLALFYTFQHLLNPSYINQSFFDSVYSFFTSFIFKDDFLYLYDYVHWEEKKINELLKSQYGWESDEKYGKNQWRMGDGQTAFTNYIYYKLAGFTEFDEFRASQVRYGELTREKALDFIKEDNQPKFQTLKSFAETIGFNLESVLTKINLIEPIYKK